MLTAQALLVKLLINPFHGFYTRLLAALGFRRFSGHLLWVSGITGNWSLVDCGANRGVFLTRTLNQLHLPTSVVCVEANSVLAEQLPKPAGVSVTVLNRAVVADDDGAEVKFSISENCEASSIYTSVADVFGVGKTVMVHKITLSTLVDMLPVDGQIVVKLDIEGAELDVLEKIPGECLRRIHQLTVEFHDNLDPRMGPRVQGIIQSLRSQGFVVLKGDAPGNDDVLFLNAASSPWWERLPGVPAARVLLCTRGLLRALLVTARTNCLQKWA